MTLKGNSGFTFLEVMIAFSIMSLVLVSIFQLQSQSIALGARTRFNAIAPMLAQEKLTEIVTHPEDLSLSGTGDFGESFPGYRWESTISDTEFDSLDDTTNRLKKIDVQVTAEEQNNQYHLQTYYFFDQAP